MKALQQKVASCDESQQTCDADKTRLERLEKLAIKLEAAPQAFGLKILRLQEKLVSAQQTLKHAETNDAAKDKQQKLEEKSTQLQKSYADHLAVLRWLEAPQ